jgi:hypothetical protein
MTEREMVELSERQQILLSIKENCAHRTMDVVLKSTQRNITENCSSIIPHNETDFFQRVE